MNTKTKLTALLMSILMIVAMLPVFALTASAEDYVAEVSVDGGEFVKKTTFDDALAVAKGATNTKGAIIRLLKNTDMGATQYVPRNGFGATLGGKTVTLDLNGCVLMPPTTVDEVNNPESKYNHFALYSTDNLTIMDSNPTQQHWYSVNEDTGLYTWVEAAETDESVRETLEMVPGGALTGGRTLVNYGGCIYLNSNTAMLTVLGGNIIGNQGTGTSASSSGIQIGKPGAVVKIAGGTFIGNLGIPGYNNRVNLYNKGNGVVVISGGTFYGMKGYNDGTINGYTVTPGTKTSIAAPNEHIGGGVTVSFPDVAFMGAQQSTDKTAIRLIAAVKNSALATATEAGFKVSVNDDEEKFAVTKYYTTLLAQTNGDDMKEILPRYGDCVMIAIIIEDVPQTGAVTFNVTPYLNETTSATATVTVTDGVVALGWAE